MRRPLLFTLLPALSLFASAAPAAAQVATGTNVNRFEPSERGSDWFANESLDLRGKARPALGLVGDYAYRQLVIYDADGSVRHSVVRNNLFVHAGANLTLFDRVRIAASMPLQAFADGRGGSFDGVFYAPPTHNQGVGDLRAGLDLRLFGEYGGPATMALGVQGWAPTGQRSQYAGEGELRMRPRLSFAGSTRHVAYAAQVGFHYRPTAVELAGERLTSEMTFSAALGLKAAKGKLTVGPEIFGSTLSRDPFSRRATPLEAILGLHYWAGEQMKLSAGAGTGLTRGFGAPEFRGLLGLEWIPGVVTDQDGDGIEDRDDACPRERGIQTRDPATNGCPMALLAPVPADRDKDGVPDASDACVDVPGVHTDKPATDGCPPDSDGDGILDKDDVCPDVAGIKTDDPATNGCPDSDGDGVLDKDDACRDVAGIKSADPKTNGCPDPDRDKDGVANDQDACPDEAGEASADPKRNGCPKAFVQAGQIRILDQVKFKTASAEILPGPESAAVLDAVAKTLVAHPEISKLRVEGHTDNRGAAARNKKLSAARAASVVKWLVAHGVDAARLTSVGRGQEQPTDSNDSEDGRRNNRRVEFHIEEPAGGKADAPAP